MAADIAIPALWFDVGNKRYTTENISKRMIEGCGLM